MKLGRRRRRRRRRWRRPPALTPWIDRSLQSEADGRGGDVDRRDSGGDHLPIGDTREAPTNSPAAAAFDAVLEDLDLS